MTRRRGNPGKEATPRDTRIAVRVTADLAARIDADVRGGESRNDAIIRMLRLALRPPEDPTVYLSVDGGGDDPEVLGVGDTPEAALEQVRPHPDTAPVVVELRILGEHAEHARSVMLDGEWRV